MTRTLAFAVLLTGCASMPANAPTCAAASVLAVLDSIAAQRPSGVEDAARCWLDLRDARGGPESAPQHVLELEAALANGVGIASALAEADDREPGVLR